MRLQNFDFEHYTLILSRVAHRYEINDWLIGVKKLIANMSHNRYISYSHRIHNNFSCIIFHPIVKFDQRYSESSEWSFYNYINLPVILLENYRKRITSRFYRSSCNKEHGYFHFSDKSRIFGMFYKITVGCRKRKSGYEINGHRRSFRWTIPTATYL